MRLSALLAVALLLLTPAGALAKTGRNLVSEEALQRALERARKAPSLQAEIDAHTQAIAWLLGLSDDEVWNLVPRADQLRAINVHFGSDCPVHGVEIHRKGGHYPWILSRDLPFHVKCPVGGEVYPDAEHPDDGRGWVDPAGERYYFVAYYLMWQVWMTDVVKGIGHLGDAYLFTSDRRYAHVAAILLSKLANEYASLDWRTQGVSIGKHPCPPPLRGKLFDQIWENNTVEACARGYDLVFPAIDGDVALAEFLAKKGISDAKKHIETDLLQTMAACIMEGPPGPYGTIRGNLGTYQASLATLAIVLDNHDPARGTTQEAMRDLILDGNGEVQEILWNGFTRDGAGGEASPGYAAGWTRQFYEIADRLAKIGVDLHQHPKLDLLALFPLELAVGGEWTPDIGDSGGIQGTRRVGWDASVLERAWRHGHDPRLAQALAKLGARTGGLWRDSIDKELAPVVEREGTTIAAPTRVLGGFGAVILEARDGAASPRVGASLYFGNAAGGHGHRDRLTLELWALDRPVLTEMGYPAHWLPKNDYWTTNTISHYSVLVDEKPQATRDPGRLELFAASPSVQLAEASAEGVAYAVPLYRRTVALVDSYLVDIFRVSGGKQHDWSFHGPPFPGFNLEGASFAPPTSGTLAGEGIAFGQAWANRESGFQYLWNVQRSRPAGAFAAQWSDPGHGAHLRVTVPAGSVQELIVADAEPELQPGAPKTMKYLIGRNKGGASKYVAVVEAYTDESSVRGVESWHSGDSVALAISRTQATDYVFSTLDRSAIDPILSSSMPLHFQGAFGVATVESGAVTRAFLASATELRAGGFVLEADPPLHGRVLAVDHTGKTVTLDGPLPDSAVGSVVFFESGPHRTSYTIARLDDDRGRARITFKDTVLLVGYGRVTASGEHEVATDTRLTGYGCADDGRHAGRWLLDGEQKHAFSIVGFDDKRFTLAGPDARPLLPPGSRFWIADVGAGDRWELATVVHVSRQGPGRYSVQANVPFRLRAP